MFFLHYNLDQGRPIDRSRRQCWNITLYVSVSQPGGREIKLQYNIFTNIMTRMLSNVKNI